ncbi:hypothetical protein FTW19_17225 [Terriglobus albidus]|uniref:Uncharacterized protein n=1 Tax=Terriglobus albidus TaxID=1592106 RepID=A0A5B9ECZ3_9BACT|nr:hypothetical protein [Terriglobus albidus]QEE29579.1 hypothetical protein FTW19_17225 [Terriglobus albidus]
MRHKNIKNRFQDQIGELAPVSVALLLMSVIPPCRAQSTSRPTAAAKSHFQSREKLNSKIANPAPAPAPAPAASPAAVRLNGGMLTVNADNSELRQVLQDISRESGMAIQGKVRDARIFGNYGPGEPSAVLTELLAGQGYNILMIGGGREGAPRQLLLTDRSNGPALPSPQPAIQNKAERVELGPGAIAHPPPEAVDDPQMRTYLRDRKLQQMYESQEKENKGNPAPPK